MKILKFIAILSVCMLCMSPFTVYAAPSAQAKQETVVQNPKEETKLAKHLSILFIGNSTSYHEYVPGDWEAAWGMAASIPSNDYIHKTEELLEKTYENVDTAVVKFDKWEKATDRTPDIYLPMIDPYLLQQPDVIVIQLGENVSDETTFPYDLTSLIQYIVTQCPSAQLIMIGETVEFWDGQTVESTKRFVADTLKIPYVNTEELIKDENFQTEYMAGLGSTYVGIDDIVHSITHPDIAKHLNDQGMLWIARHLTNTILRTQNLPATEDLISTRQSAPSSV